MAINIGMIILQLRKEKQLTQEQLSEILGVSTTAVCKWETGATYPDIELLPVLAEFFGISVDGLLGYDMHKTEADIKEQIGVGIGFINDNQIKEALAYFSKLAYRYPNHFDILRFYAIAKGLAIGQSDNEQFKNMMQNEQDELMRQCKVLAAKMSRKEQDIIISDILMGQIVRKDFVKAEQTLAEIEPCGYYPFLDYDSGVFWLETHRGDMEEAERKYFRLFDILHKDVFIFARHNIYQNMPVQLIKQNNKMIQVYEILSEEFTKKSCFPLAFLHESNAIAYFKLGEKDKAFNELEEFAKSIANMPDAESYKNVISRFFLNPSFYFVINREDEEEAYEFIKNTYESL